jgi:HlyD family secretion protein
VGKIRLNATMTQNVVTYTVEVVTNNSNGKLLPYLTANVQFEIARHANVLTVPTAALHWMPNSQEVVAQPAGRHTFSANSGEHAQTSTPPGPTESNQAQAQRVVLWVMAGNGVKPLNAWAGLSDGQYTEVSGEGLREGLEVVSGETRQNNDAAAANDNPFTPQIFRRGRQNAQGPKPQR